MFYIFQSFRCKNSVCGILLYTCSILFVLCVYVGEEVGRGAVSEIHGQDLVCMPSYCRYSIKTIALDVASFC